MLAAGAAEKFLLAEGGSRLWHGNFSWGYILAVYLLWFISIRDFAAWKCTFVHSSGVKKWISITAWVLCGVILLAHLVSGIYYLYYLIVLGNGI